MINKLKIKNIKNLNQLKLDNLGLINVIIGNSKSGKTTILQSINLFKDPLSIEHICKNFNNFTFNCYDYFTIDNIFKLKEKINCKTLFR